MTNVLEFDFGNQFTAVLDSTLTTPELHSALAVTASEDAHINVAIDWSKGSEGDWSQLFKYKTTADDFVDSEATDLVYGTNTTEWYTSNLMSATATLSNGTGTLPTVSCDTIAKELLAQIAKQIFGQEGAMDLLKNEAAMLSSCEGINTAISTAIDTLLDASEVKGAAGEKDTLNFAYQALTKILANEPGAADGSATSRSVAAMAAHTAGQFNFVPFIAGDTIVFTIAISPKFGGSSTNNGHGIGDNTVAQRKYKITLTLTN